MKEGLKRGVKVKTEWKCLLNKQKHPGTSGIMNQKSDVENYQHF